MLEGLAAWILNTYVGEYVENLNTDQLSIGLLSGAVELENLPLRKDALKNLDLPIEVKAGFIGKIVLQIPVRHIKSEPCVISIDSLYLVAGPAVKVSYDEEKEKQAKQESTKQQLEALESQWKAKFEKAAPESGSSWYAYSTSLFYNVLENIQLKIRDVHIRYEDTTTIPNETFAFGITIKSLSAQSTDENWKAKIVQGEKGAMKFKLLQLENFAMYWDTNIQLYGDMNIKDLKDALQKREFSADTTTAKQHEYLVEPVSAEAKLRRNGSPLPLRSRSTPRFICDVNLQKIPLSLSEEQYHGTFALAREFERSGRARLYRQWRPAVPVKAHGREWWNFAITSTLHGIRERNKRRSPQFISQRIQNNQRYIRAYTKILEGSTPDSESKACMDEMETDLEFDELRLLRELTFRQLEKRISAGEEFFKKPEQDSSQQEGLMQRWVWGWGGWYSGGTAAADQSGGSGTASAGTGTATRSVSPPPIDEQELMDVIGDPMADSTLLKRDHVFALLNLNLQGGSFKLCSSSNNPVHITPSPTPPKRLANNGAAIIELEFASVKMSLESRLRTSSMLFTAKLGSLYVRDVMTKGSLFPVLVSPQQKRDDVSSTQSRQHFGILSKTSVSYMAQSAAYQRQSSEETLFEMSYESNPPNSNADCRLEIITRPLDMVYNPSAMQRISDFFNSPAAKSKGLASRPSELQLTRMARLRYEELKNQTKQELRHTLDTLLEGEQQSQVSRWDIHLDISAPQIIIPDSFHSKDATLVVLDFGHLQLASATAKGNYAKVQKSQDDSLNEEGDLDDDFLTPLSTPPNESSSDEPPGSVHQTDSASFDELQSGLQSVDFGNVVTEGTMRDRMYDRYNLNMSDLQVLVGKATDNWRSAHTKGSSHMQVIEKFTISVKVERRLMFTTDPQWPSAMISGNLPSLAIHINEQKIQALNICLKLMTGPSEGASSPASTAGTPVTYDLADVNRTHTTSLSEMEATFTQRTQALLEESKLLEMQFSVDQLSLSVESRGRCIAECQVYGVKANLGKQPYNTSLSLTVHGLLLIDALQQFGPEFELLLASHRDLSLHLPSGSIVDSEHTTPRSLQSPTSPQSPASPAERMMDSSSQSVLASALSAIGGSTSGTSVGKTSGSSKLQEQLVADSKRHTMTDTVGDEGTEALITVQVELISPDCPSNSNSSREALQIASVQFNNLDVIANQETIVELLSFFHRAFPDDSKEPTPQTTLQGDTSTFELESISSTKTEVTADFHCLNVVLVRGETDQHKHVIGRKVATATVTAAHVWAMLGGDFHLEGSLGGLQLLDVTPEGSRHKKVFSVGRDPQAMNDLSTSTLVPPLSSENGDLYRTAMERTCIEDVDLEEFKAFSFTLKKTEGACMSPLDSRTQTPDFDVRNSQTSDGFDLTLHLASLCYTHVPRFLHDITLCVDEFQSSAAALADSIQKAAALVAMDFVRQKSDLAASVASPMLYSTRIETPVRGGVDASDGTLEEKPSSLDVKFKMTMETPIIIIPRSALSSEVLVAHLGKISITNTAVTGENTIGSPGENQSFSEANGIIMPATTKLYLGMRDIKVSSFNHLDSKSRAGSFVSTDSRDSVNSGQSLYKGTPILHDTSLELTINQLPMETSTMPSDYSMDTLGSDESFVLPEESSPTTSVSGRVVSPLKVILSKHVYEQILQTMDNLTYKENKDTESKRAPSTAETPTGGLFMWQVDPADTNVPIDSELDKTEKPDVDNLENETKESHTKVKVDFHLPEFSVEMCGNTCDGDQGLVNLTFQNFSVEFVNTTPSTSSIDVTLQSLIMEDLLQPPFSKHRYLMVSTGGPRVLNPTPRMFHSSSCPSISTLMSPIPIRPGSLPSALDSPPAPNYSYHTPRYGHPGAKGVPLIPSTPPPSLNESLENIPEGDVSDASSVSKNALMRIKVMLVDRECPEFATKYKRVNRFVDVTFNSLDTTINLQTWVVLLDFLGIGGPAPKSRASPEEKALWRLKKKAASKASSSRTDAEVLSSSVELKIQDEVNTEMAIQVGSLSLLLNKPDYELAKANVSEVSAHLLLMDGNVDVSGRLGSISLLDLTPHGKLYRERFSTKGQEALSFSIFKYGQPDPNLDRNFDLRIKLRMSSVRYIHTNRFQMETIAFAQHFNQLQEVLGTMRAASDGIEVKEDPKRASRISLDIEAGSPVCIAPISSKSKDVLVVNLGNLTLKNEFLMAGSEGTIAKLPSKVASDDVQFSKESVNHVCLLDCMHLDLSDMDLFSAERVEHVNFNARDDTAMIFPSFVICRKGGRLLKNTCMLRLQVDRNLDADISRAAPDFSVSGMLSSVHCSLDVAQYQLIRGMLDHNLGEKLEEFQSMQRTQNPVNQTVLSGHVWTSVSLHVQLVNVTLELLHSHQQGNTPQHSLGKFDFIESRFSFESFSDTTKTIDLVSHAIRASDTRWKDQDTSGKPPSNVFWEVLTPTRHHSRNPNPLQLELHYASQLDHTRATVLLNNMRVMCVMDLLLAAKDFLLEYDAKSVQADCGSTAKAHGASSNGSSNQSSAPSSTTATRDKRSGTPVNVASGIFTKRAQAAEKSDNPLEIRLNITETEFVLMEDTACSDSSAVILKATCAVMTYKMDNKENPLSCSLEGLEVFSCCLSNEDTTALSIVDPVTVNAELKANPMSISSQGRTGGLLDVMEAHRTLEVHIQALNIRVSYHDARLFLAIMNSLPAQMLQTENKEEDDMSKKSVVSSTSKSKQVSKLQELGFTREDCKIALTNSNGQLDQAATWLLENAKPMHSALIPRHGIDDEDGEGALEIAGVEVRAGSVSICLIDDCKDSDVPLIEVMLQNLHVFQKLLPNIQGTASGTLMGDYYNRSLSGWEPFIEPWKLHVEWIQQDETVEYAEKLFVQCKVNERLDLNLTSALIDLYSNTKKNWTEDYYNKTGKQEGLTVRHRSPFVPFALRNLSGRRLWFSTLTTNPNRVANSPTEKLASPLVSVGGSSSWTEVAPGDEIPFVFEEKGKQRHRNTHELRVHQLLVRVEGWERMSPVSVDKVGTFFRLAKPEHTHMTSIFTSQRVARVLFHVTLEGSARKLVTVQSALTVVSHLSVPMDIKLINPDSTTDVPVHLPLLSANASQPVPLSHTDWLMYIRPHGWGMEFCERPIHWQSVYLPKATDTQPNKCRFGSSDEDGIFRFCAYIRHEGFPQDSFVKRSPSFLELSRKQDSEEQELKAGHTITLLPPMVLTNLLPFDLKYKMHRTGVVGHIRPGKDQPIYDADLTQSNDISFTMDNFQDCHTPLSLPPRLTKDAHGYILLRDSHPKKRCLLLKARVECRAGRCLKILICARYWLINKSGLPLIFKQEGADFDAAGQFEVHEQARSVAPLVFSYADREKADMCTMRLGRGVIGLNDVPHYCQRISLEGGSGVRSLRVYQQGGRPHMVYHIGIDIRPGRGRYHDTQVVTFVPRFQLENRSSCKLAFAQRHLVQGIGSRNPSEHLSVMSGSSVIFHWPRDDLDKLLCARIATDDSCRWSGGMRIDQPYSFNINMRSAGNQSNIMHVGVSLVGATFFVVFSDATHMPPPYRIDNMSEVNLIYYQSKVADTNLRTVIRPKTSVPYTWDELVLPRELYCEVKGGSGATFKLDVLSDGIMLHYENFIYLCMTHTFTGSSSSLSSSLTYRKDDHSSLNLVFDLDPKTKAVILRKKEPGKRSQLWHMTKTGMLQNQALVPPRDPNRAPSSTHNPLVLDIADLAAHPNSFMPLVMRKSDERRKGTQTWFSHEGRLLCHLGGLAVQAKGGIMGLRDGCEVVLGPADVKITDRVPVEQAIHSQKNLPGSGSLNTKVMSDGPTRVLQITDTWSQQSTPTGSGRGLKDEWVYVKDSKDSKSGRNARPVVRTHDTQGDTPKIKEVDVIFFLSEGVGLSLVNSIPEEVLYISLSGFEVQYLDTKQEMSLKVQIKKIQVDNQLIGAQKPVVLFVTPSNSEEKPNSAGIPALCMAITKLPSSHEMVDIYKLFYVNLCKMTLNLEELLLLKFVQFAGFAQLDSEIEKMDESYYNSLRPVSVEQKAKRFFFETLKLNATEFKLSVLTTSKLPPDLKALKTQQRLFLIQFEDAPVSLDPFTRLHPFETQEFLLDAVIKHYTEELKSQAVKILGSVDFLGNPIGLIQDLRDGLKELILEGNVTGMVKNVTHGMSNTAAKVTGSISNTLGTVIMDNQHEEIRSSIRESHDGSSSSHLKAGLKGLTFGVVGGLTSIFTQTYQGVSEDGVEGLVKGFGKGVIGTVAKPVVGVMDLASGTMAAIRSSTVSESHLVPQRVRLTRCCINPAGMLPRYSPYNARGQEYIPKLSEASNNKERFFSMETLRSSPTEGMEVLITSECTYFLPVNNPLSPVLQVNHSELFHARHIQHGGKHYTELTKMANTEAGVSASRYDSKERPKVGCDNERIAKKVSQQINYAKGCYEELKQQVMMDTSDTNLRLELVSEDDT